jgi:hypothetical protein
VRRRRRSVSPERIHPSIVVDGGNTIQEVHGADDYEDGTSRL